MMPALRSLALAPLLVLAAGCGDAEEPAAIEDPSKLSAELEREADAIEQRAAEAVREAEALADEELQQLRAEAAAASAGSAEAEVPVPAKDE